MNGLSAAMDDKELKKQIAVENLFRYLEMLTALGKSGITVHGEVNAVTEALNQQLGINPRFGEQKVQAHEKRTDRVVRRLRREDMKAIAKHLREILKESPASVAHAKAIVDVIGNEPDPAVSGDILDVALKSESPNQKNYQSEREAHRG